MFYGNKEEEFPQRWVLYSNMCDFSYSKQVIPDCEGLLALTLIYVIGCSEENCLLLYCPFCVSPPSPCFFVGVKYLWSQDYHSTQRSCGYAKSEAWGWSYG